MTIGSVWSEEQMFPDTDAAGSGGSRIRFFLFRRNRIRAVACLILLIHIGLVGWLGLRQSPNIDETAHMAAGMAMWQYGSFEYYPVNPPLVRAVATLPVYLQRHEPLWGDFEGASRADRPEFVLGAQFVESHPERWRVFITSARWAIIPISVLGGIFCFVWASELFSPRAGLVALCLWCFSPNVITWSAVICTDVAAATFGVGAAWLFWRWLKTPTRQTTVLAGILLGAALLSKMTWIVLLIAWPVHWLIDSYLCRRQGTSGPSFLRLICVIVIGIYTVNLGYGFRGSFTAFGDFTFRSALLTGEIDDVDSAASNRFSDSVLGRIPVPFPGPMVTGIDQQRYDFQIGMPSYLFGKWQNHGWWYYYLWGIALKVPLGTLALACLTLAMVSMHLRSSEGRSGTGDSTFRHSIDPRDQLSVLLPGIVVLVLVSSQDGFSRHFRYVLPAFPFAFIWISQAVSMPAFRRYPIIRGGFQCLLCLSVVSSAATYPHTMAYFNVLAGGPASGHRQMLGSSLSWSQDQGYLSEWMAEHPQVDSPYVLLDRPVSVKRLGIRSRGVPPPLTLHDDSDLTSAPGGPVPGWHVISIQKIHEPDGRYRYFLDLQPNTVIGHSIHIYHLNTNEANTLRQSLGLAALSDRRELPESFLEMLATKKDSSERLRLAMFVPTIADPDDGESIESVLSAEKGLVASVVSEHQIRAGALETIDVLVVPGGKSSVYGTSLGSDGRDAVRRFVAEGGGYVGICAGARLATVSPEWALQLVNARCVEGKRFVPGHGIVSVAFRGWGSVLMDGTDDGRRIFENLTEKISLEHTGGPVFIRANHADLPDYVSLATFKSELQMYPFQKDGMVNTPAVLASRYGDGSVILFSPHPESTTVGATMLIEAIKAVSPDRKNARQSERSQRSD